MPKIDFFDNLKKKLLSSCTKCKNSGWINQDKCECLSRFERYFDYHESGIDREYWDKSLEHWQGDPKAKEIIERYIKNFDQVFQSGHGLIFNGPVGTGKTLLAISVLKEAYNRSHSIRLISIVELMELMFSKIKDVSVKKEYDEYIIKSDFLCIDNLGLEYQSSYFKNVAFELEVLIRNRSRNLLPTFVTTNLSIDEFMNSYGHSTLSILMSRASFVEVSGEDFRLKQHKEFQEKLRGSNT